MAASVIYGRPYGKGSYVKLKTVTQTSVKLTAFQGKKFKAGTAWQFQATAQKKQKNSWVSGKKTTLTVITTPETPSVVKTSSGKNSVKVQWKKLSNATGYQVYLAKGKNGKFALAATVKKSGSVSAVLKKLDRKTDYYVKVRSFKTAEKKTVYSTFSKARKVRTK